MLCTKFQGNQPFGSRDVFFFFFPKFLPYIDMAATLVM